MRVLLLALLLGISALQLSYAQGQSISATSLVGKWSASEKMANGATMSTSLTLTQNMKFSGVATVQGTEVWNYSGTWEVNGNQLIWHYQNSSPPLPESAKTDVDDIASVDATKLVLVSHLSGKQHEFARTK
jgi:hypothetical protein